MLSASRTGAEERDNVMFQVQSGRALWAPKYGRTGCLNPALLAGIIRILGAAAQSTHGRVILNDGSCVSLVSLLNKKNICGCVTSTLK